MVLCVGLNSTDTPCSPGPGSTLKVLLGNGTAMLRPEAENMRADLADTQNQMIPRPASYETCRIKHRQATGHVEARGINRTSKASRDWLGTSRILKRPSKMQVGPRTRRASSIVICFASMASASVERP